jgi:hypothetical protein
MVAPPSDHCETPAEVSVAVSHFAEYATFPAGAGNARCPFWDDRSLLVV